jgi:hypothetical protein
MRSRRTRSPPSHTTVSPSETLAMVQTGAPTSVGSREAAGAAAGAAHCPARHGASRGAVELRVPLLKAGCALGARLSPASHAQPRPRLQFLLRAMKLSPHAFPLCKPGACARFDGAQHRTGIAKLHGTQRCGGYAEEKEHEEREEESSPHRRRGAVTWWRWWSPAPSRRQPRRLVPQKRHRTGAFARMRQPTPT